jgi:hypothetical protein
MAWIFLAESPLDLERSIRFLTVQHSVPGYGGIFGGPILSAVVAIVCAVAWWKIWNKARWARIWGIAASLSFIADFIQQFVPPFQRVWAWNIGALWVGVLGLVLFLRPGIWADAESARNMN